MEPTSTIVLVRASSIFHEIVSISKENDGVAPRIDIIDSIQSAFHQFLARSFLRFDGPGKRNSVKVQNAIHDAPSRRREEPIEVGPRHSGF
jgi:hypothetical protein